MRIGIDYRVMSTDAAGRGMGRYTQQQLRGVLRRDNENEYVVIRFPGCREDLVDREVRAATNVTMDRFSSSMLDRGPEGVRVTDILEFSAEFQEWLVDRRIDAYHATTPFLPPVFADFDACPLVATLYDLIPLVYPGAYFSRDASASPGYPEYLRGLQLVSRAQRVIAISESARSDAATYLGYPKERCEVSYPAVESHFRPLSRKETTKALKRLSRRTPIPERFVLSITGIHHSKNAATLVAAHRLLATHPDALPLVVVVPTPAAFDAFEPRFDPHESVAVIHGVSDEELCALMNEAMFVVHPSRYEGFGYPVVEAMSCGAPVITTTSSSLTEVGGDAAVLVDPDDVGGLAAAMLELADSPERRETMRRRGFKHVRRFASERLGEATLEVYGAAGTSASDEVHHARRVAVWSSLPPLHCGVADYTAELLDALSERAEVEVFADGGYMPSASLVGRQTIHHFSAFDRRRQQQPFDAVIYQMGGTVMQKFMYDAVATTPGIVVLHDLLMGLGFFSVYRLNGAMDTFRNRILSAEGEVPAREFARVMRRTRFGDPTSALWDLFAEHYLLRWIIDASLAQVVHIEEAKRALEKRYPDARVFVIDMGVEDPWLGKTRTDAVRARWKHGLPASTFTIGTFGNVVPVKRIEVCLEALAVLRAGGLDGILVVAGAHLDPAYAARLDELCHSLGVVDAVRMLKRVPRADFDELIIACDVVVNLRFPSLLGMSATLVRALAAGKPLIVSDVPEWRYLASEACWPVAPGGSEINDIAARLEALARDPKLYEAASTGARRFYDRRGTLGHMAEQYLEAVEAVVAHSAPAPVAVA